MKNMKIFGSVATVLHLLFATHLAHAQYQEVLPDNSFIGLTFHDVRDDVLKQGDKDVYAISTQHLVQYFEWLKQSKWHPVSLKQILDAKKKGQPLPENSVLISFDDGALSGYTHVYPLIQQYQIPVVFAIVTSWTNGNTQAAYEAYGNGNLMSWAQMREMQKSGLVEFASHSDDLHKGVMANPQNNQQPAALTHQYFPKDNRYENDQQYQQRVYADLKKSKDILRKELNVDSLAIIWPYGAVSPETTKIAERAGFPLSFSLGVDSLNKKADSTFQRGLVMNNPSAEDLHQQMTEFVNYQHLSNAVPMRALTLDLKQFKSASIDQGNQILGMALNQISALASNTLILKVLNDENHDGVYDQAYFPTLHLAVDQDLTNRVTWQARTRVFNRVTAQLPLYPDPNRPALALDLAEDLVKNNKGIDGIMLNAGNRLQCIFQRSETLDLPCQERLNQIIQLSDGIQKRTHPYLNISNNQRFSLQLQYQPADNSSLVQTFNRLKNHYSLINFQINSLKQPKALQGFIEQAQALSALDKSRLMVTLNSDDIQKTQMPQQWQQLQQDLLSLQRIGIQKLAINEYSFQNAAQVHQYLYTPLSLNPNSLLYRDPFQLESKQGAQK